MVDDCADTVEVISTLFRLLGHECRGARTGQAAIDEALAFAPDIVLLDLVLPDMNGLAVGPTLRRALGKKFYMAALTGLGMATDRERTHRAGFDEHLVKPIDGGTLRDVVVRAALAQV